MVTFPPECKTNEEKVQYLKNEVIKAYTIQVNNYETHIDSLKTYLRFISNLLNIASLTKDWTTIDKIIESIKEIT